ncbi:Cell death specification protein 2 [Toxocara canis]|uniref:Cell death specification protein 2 n=2 Tax=Toxocara canis TaxID=6265 RepID=A0A0B2VI22_TOXCA|nr:Cell death specification protein 2 [Toxocara canis]VDM50032.1 unnamed protein product [Toxocara canis]
MAADGGHDISDMQSSATTCQMHNKDEIGPHQRASTTTRSDFSSTPSSSPSNQKALPMFLSSTSLPSTYFSANLLDGLSERIQGDEKKYSSPSECNRKFALLPPCASAEQFAVLNMHLMMLRQRTRHDSEIDTAFHSAIIPFRKIDLMLSLDHNRCDKKSVSSDDMRLPVVSLNSTNAKYTTNDYEERRRRNNDAARRSREARRAKAAQNRSRLLRLEEENSQLRLQIEALRGQLNQMQLLLMASKAAHCVL